MVDTYRDDGIFTCYRCKFKGRREKFVSAGKKRPPQECKECQRKRSKEGYLRNKNTYKRRSIRRRFEYYELIRKIKTNNACLDCKNKYHYSQMDFDHRDQSEKLQPISKMSQSSLNTVIKEIKKCDLICANCHRLRTQEQIKESPSSDLRWQNIKEYVKKQKKGKPCADCKREFPYYVMDYDHIENKLFTISRMKNGKYSIKRIKEEMEKCELICVNCHRLRSWKRSREERMGPT